MESEQIPGVKFYVYDMANYGTNSDLNGVKLFPALRF